MEFPKPNVVVSRCLGFDACRYNGQMLRDDFVERLRPHVRFIPVCPEAEIGLGVPRFPVRVARVGGRIRLIQPATGLDASEKMLSFSESFLSAGGAWDGFLLKNRSPSCGMGDVRLYNSASAGAGVEGKGPGFFGGAALSQYSHLAAEDEGRLKNYRIREHFLSKLFALSRLRAARGMGGLVDFHSRNKFLIMAYGQKGLNELGNIAANRTGLPAVQAVELYRRAFGSALSKPPGRKPMSNALMHAVGFFSKTLSAREKLFFSDSLSIYKEGRIPYSSVLAVLRAWAVREGNEYVLNQAIFSPYPKELAELKDSGKALDI